MKNTKIDIVDGDLKEDVKRPAFKIFMDTIKTEHFSSAIKETKVYFNIYYYAENLRHSKVEFMDIIDKISNCFLKPLEINENCAVYVDDLEFEKVEDGILNCSFNFEIGTIIESDNGEYEDMEELIIK